MNAIHGPRREHEFISSWLALAVVIGCGAIRWSQSQSVEALKV